jgi:hypothetical protein
LPIDQGDALQGECCIVIDDKNLPEFVSIQDDLAVAPNGGVILDCIGARGNCVGRITALKGHIPTIVQGCL